MTNLHIKREYETAVGDERTTKIELTRIEQDIESCLRVQAGMAARIIELRAAKVHTQTIRAEALRIIERTAPVYETAKEAIKKEVRIDRKIESLKKQLNALKKWQRLK